MRAPMQLVSVLAFFLLFSTSPHSASAQSQSCYAWTHVGVNGCSQSIDGQWSSASDAAQQAWSSCAPSFNEPGWSVGSCSVEAASSGATGSICTIGPDGVGGTGAVLTATAVSCPTNPCTQLAGKQVDTVVSGGAVASGTTTYDQQGCAMTVTSNPVNIVGCHGGCAVQSATYTGQQQQNASPQTQAGSNCVTGSGGTFCSEDQSGKNCGTFNGDEVCPGSLPPGTCVSYASGGVACTQAVGASSVPSPPGPDNGTPGHPASPTGQVQAPVTTNGVTTQVTTNYYDSTTVNTSTGGIASSSGGLNVGNGGSFGSGTVGGNGSGSGPSAADGDCGASGVSCDPGLPTLPDQSSILESSQTYMTGLSSVPIVAAVSGIAASVPVGQCPTGQFSIYGSVYTIDAQCVLWDSVKGIVQLCMLAVWTLVGVRILMSA